MGDLTSYIPSGGFSEYLYHDVGDVITASNGVQGKVINKFTDPNDEEFHESLPLFSNTSEVYFKKTDQVAGHWATPFAIEYLTKYDNHKTKFQSRSREGKSQKITRGGKSPYRN